MMNIALNQEAIRAFCTRWRVARMAVFGSVLRPSFTPDSDVDLLVDLVRMKEELQRIIGREVDLVSRRGLQASRNHIRKQEILNSAEVVYAA